MPQIRLSKSITYSCPKCWAVRRVPCPDLSEAADLVQYCDECGLEPMVVVADDWRSEDSDGLTLPSHGA